MAFREFLQKHTHSCKFICVIQFFVFLISNNNKNPNFFEEIALIEVLISLESHQIKPRGVENMQFSKQKKKKNYPLTMDS